ncbi:MAG TPA: pitrilysin family protein [Acidimicrobiales bacterium]|jgi:zinc protease|nr:pitrilysin family protein [Acidimicrobiales bacterium]
MPTRTSRPSRLPAPALAVERATLKNGLRVVLSPDRSAPTIATTVNYDVGFRSEPEGRTGFAHLFEHLCFQGTATLDKGEADRLIEGNGGIGNGSTRSDYTNYLAMLPSNALDLALFLEADRMRGVRLTEESLQNQIDVVKEEIRVNVLNRPYGGFPWIDLPPIMYRTFNNAHNGYGSFVDLESATVDDAADFFDTYYAPGNAVLAVAGDLDVDATLNLIEKHFGDIPARPVAPPPDCGEPAPDEERRGQKVDPMAPVPALAAGYRVPDPINELDDFLAAVVLVELLTDGDASRLYQRLVKRDRLASHLGGMIGTFGDALDVRDPTMLQVLAYHPGVAADSVLAAVDEEVDRIANDGVADDELRRVVVSFVSGHLRRIDNLLQRTMLMCTLEQQRHRAEVVNELPSLLEAVDAASVMKVAQTWIRPNKRAVLEVVPGAAQ